MMNVTCVIMRLDYSGARWWWACGRALHPLAPTPPASEMQSLPTLQHLSTFAMHVA